MTESLDSGAYALNALNPDEVKAFEAHLARSQESRNEVTELTDTAVMLGLAVAPETPSPALKASILAQIAVTPQLQPEPSRVDARPESPAQLKARARWFQKPLTAVAGLAAAVALILGGGVAVTALTESAVQQAAADQLSALYAASDSQTVKGTVAGGGQATLVYAASLKSSALIVKGMNPLPADKVYELWYIDAQGARSAGTFTVGTDGSMWQLLEGEMARGDTVGVTVEPAGGSEAPTTDPVLVLASA